MIITVHLNLTCGYSVLVPQVEFFEPFWDSGEPRVGERLARGWKAWMLQQERGGWLVPSEPGRPETLLQRAGLQINKWICLFVYYLLLITF